MKLDVKFSENNQCFELNVGQIQTVTEFVGGELYEGEYDVTPKVTEQMLRTKGKVLADDVRVKEIPYYDVSNTSGGSTIYIGNEV